MKRIFQTLSQLLICALLMVFLFATSCNGQKATETVKKTATTYAASAPRTNVMGTVRDSVKLPSPLYGPLPNPIVQISKHIYNIFQDKAGNIWFATEGDGVCRYNGKSYNYFTTQNGLSGDAVRSILQDEKGNVWFATNRGVSRYDGRFFTKFTVEMV